MTLPLSPDDPASVGGAGNTGGDGLESVGGGGGGEGGGESGGEGSVKSGGGDGGVWACRAPVTDTASSIARARWTDAFMALLRFDVRAGRNAGNRSQR
jgi:hypothetical protein